MEKNTVLEVTGAIHSSYDGRAKSRFSNQSLVTYEELQSSALLHSTMQEYGQKSTPTSAERMNYPFISDVCLSKNETENCDLLAFNCEPHMKLMQEIMPNTREFEDLNSTECSRESRDQEVLEAASNKTNEREPIAKSRRNWKIILSVTWVMSLIAAFIFVTVNNFADQSSSTQPEELVTLTPTNFEICLLIGKNVRRLFVNLL